MSCFKTYLQADKIFQATLCQLTSKEAQTSVVTYAGAPCATYFVNFPSNDRSHMQIASWTSTVETFAGKKETKNTLQQIHFSSCNQLSSFICETQTLLCFRMPPQTWQRAIVLLHVDSPDNSPPPSHLYLNPSNLRKIHPLGRTSSAGQREAGPSVRPRLGSDANRSALVPGLVSDFLLRPPLSNPAHGLCHGFQT